MTAPVLVLGWGNLSRGDDALGPLCIEGLAALPWPAGAVEFLDDYQLQVEHAMDLVDRRQVLFIDASVSCAAPFEVTSVDAARDASVTTHAMSPQALLHVYQDVHGNAAPPSTLLAIRGERFELGEAPGAAAVANLAAAQRWAARWIESGLNVA